MQRFFRIADLKMMNPPHPTYETDPEILKHQVIIETYRSSGPGGQRKNKTETSVRLSHIPSEITVVATERRSQAQNLKLAFERLRDRLIRLNRPKRRRIPTRVPPGVAEKRIEAKRSRSVRKDLRRKPAREEE